MQIDINSIQEDIRERIKEILQENNMSVNKLSTLIGISQRTLNNQINNKKNEENKENKIPISTFCAIIDFFQDINFYWWVYGNAYPKYKNKPYSMPILSNNTLEENREEYGNKNESLIQNLIYPEISGLDENEKIILANTGFYSPIIPAGSYIFVTKIPNWKKFLEYGRIYYIELKDDRTLFACIQPGEEEDTKTFTLNPLNQDTPVTLLPFSLIKSIWLTRRKIEEL